MTKHFFYCFIFLFVIIGSAYSKSDVTYPKELEQLHNNLISNFLQPTVDESKVENLLSTLDSKGAWTQIDYTDLERGGWPVLQHLYNLQTLAIAYQKSGTQYYKKEELSKKIHLALNYWLDNDFQNPNWWNPEIGVPKYLSPVLFAMESELSPEQFKKGIKILNRSKIRLAGQNKVWLSGNVLYKSLLLRNADSVAIAAEAIKGELAINRLAIQPDYSFHEHGAMLQFGNYGLSFMRDMTMWIDIMNNTAFQFEKERVSLLRAYVLDGMQWVLWKKGLDIAASGRQLFKGAQIEKRNLMVGQLNEMKKLDSKYAEEYEKAKDVSSLVGNKYFWRSDFQVQRSKDYYFSLKLSSNRVRAYETANSENLQGYHLGSGMTLLYQTQNEYEDIFPFWNWKKLPGTTIIQDTSAIPVSNAWGYTIDDNFVGAVSDGENGMAVLQYNRGGLKANKSWFMFDDKIVCLGNGITAKTEFPVTTSINQTFLNGNILVKTDAGEKSVANEQEFTRLNWLLHDNIGYLFPTDAKVKLTAKNTIGSWYNVAHRYKDVSENADIFSLWIDHGKNPKNGNYAYILVPNATRAIMADLEANKPFKFVNLPNQQSVVSKNGNLAGIVFYAAGKSYVFGCVEVSKPCAVMLKKTDAGIAVSISDPSYQQKDIILKMKGNYEVENGLFESGNTTITISLPQGNEAGKTLTINLKNK